jgi:FlaA1/EpsC-like NDP-sugar epimerase
MHGSGAGLGALDREVGVIVKKPIGLKSFLSQWLIPPLHWRNRQFFVVDAIGLLFIPTLALILRTDLVSGVDDYSSGLVRYTILNLLLCLAVFYAFGLYGRYWRYASIDELVQIALAVMAATALVSSIFFGFFAFELPIFDLPRSIPLISGLLMLLWVGGSRFSVRLGERGRRALHPSIPTRRVLVMGAGDAGAMIVREMQRNPQLGMTAVGFVDDDGRKQGVRIYGVPVLGGREDIPRLAQRLKAKLVVIAMPTASGKTIRAIVAACEEAEVQTKIIPGIYELLDGRVHVNQLRDVAIEDLLRREPVKTDVAAVKELITGKRVLVTGGGGSIGSELCRQIMRFRPAEIVLLGHGENSIFAIHNELLIIASSQADVIPGPIHVNGNGLPHSAEMPPAAPTAIHPVIADIRFPQRIQAIFKQYRPDIVFHAAAHKHVHLMEMNPSEAVTNNILGTRNLLEAAGAVGVPHFVMISTDKAVNPVGMMGASKRAAELLVRRAAYQSGRPYVAVRFGNVLGSRGSVIHSFKQQIANGGPVMVTHPEMRRYFMTIPEAVQLVLQAAALGKGGEVFLLDMGEPVKIVDLARDMIELSGLEVGQDIDIAFSQPRPGEKLYEELFLTDEEYERTRHEKIFIASSAGRFAPHDLEAALSALEEAANCRNEVAISELLQTLIPEYRPAKQSVHTS